MTAKKKPTTTTTKRAKPKAKPQIRKPARRSPHPDGPEIDGSNGFSVSASYVPDGKDGDT